MLKKVKDQKNDVLLFGIIWIVTLILSNAFLQMHYSSDTYCLIDLGYLNYPQKYFLLDGRIISSIVCFLAGILHIPYSIYIIGMDFIGIIFLSFAIFFLYKYILKITNREDKIYNLLLLLLVYVIIYNPFALEYLLFPECAVMCLGVLLTVLASIKSNSYDSKKYIKIFFLLLLANICYQPVILAFPVLYLLLNFLNNENQDEKNNKLWKNIFKYAVIFIIIFFINIILLKIASQIFNTEDNRKIFFKSSYEFFSRIKNALKQLIILLYSNLNILPKCTILICIMSTIGVLCNSENKKYNILNFLLIVFVDIAIITVFNFITIPGLSGRTQYSIGMLCGISLMFLLVFWKDGKNKVNGLITFIIISYFIFNSIILLRCSSEHITANKADEIIGKQISKIVSNYEERTGIKVNKLSYEYDLQPEFYAVGIEQIGSLTESKFSCPWSIIEIFNFYCNRKFEEVEFSDEIYEKYFEGKQFDYFSEDEIIIDGDTLYFMIY